MCGGCRRNIVRLYYNRDSMSRPAVFLDRDGVINENRPDSVKSLAELRLLPGVLEALRRLAGLGQPVVIITNQAIIGRGQAARATVDAINAQLLEQIRAAGGRVDTLYLCPHAPEDHCVCRKPQPGLLLQAARELDLDLPASVFIGDALTDVQAARAAGAQPILVQTGRGREQTGPELDGVPVFADLAAAAEYLLAGPTRS